jgi:hypothetical protein
MSNNILEQLAYELKYHLQSDEEKVFVNKLRNIKRHLNRKEHYICKHEGCKESSIHSHEISEGIFLKKLTTSENKSVYVLIPDFENNSFKLKLKSEEISSATTYPRILQNT